MKLLDVVTRMIQGKPLMNPPTGGSAQSDPNASYKQDLPPEETGKRAVKTSHRFDEKGNETPPQVAMTYCNCTQKNTDSLQLWATIHNQSQINIYLDRVVLCGSDIAFDYPLAPGQTHDFLVYDGAKPTSPKDVYAQVYYRDSGTGKYYAMRHMVTFRDDQDGTFSPLSFKPLFARDAQRFTPW